jgi:hypothetical protein
MERRMREVEMRRWLASRNRYTLKRLSFNPSQKVKLNIIDYGFYDRISSLCISLLYTIVPSLLSWGSRLRLRDKPSSCYTLELYLFRFCHRTRRHKGVSPYKEGACKGAEKVLSSW